MNRGLTLIGGIGLGAGARSLLKREQVSDELLMVREHPDPEPSVPTPSDPLPPEPQPTEPPPDLFPVPKLPDERAGDSLPEITHVR